MYTDCNANRGAGAPAADLGSQGPLPPLIQLLPWGAAHLSSTVTPHGLAAPGAASARRGAGWMRQQ